RFRKGFETQPQEIQVDQLPVHGEIPAWLNGTLIRSTPAQFEVNGQSYRHWFDGLAMLHAFTLNNGSVGYANRYLQSRAYIENNREGRIKYGEFATDPCRSLFSRVFSFFQQSQLGGNTNVSITRLADEYIMRTEYPMSTKFDPQTLETLGVYDHGGMNGQLTSAHPHHDFDRRTDYNYQLDLGRENAYNFYGLPGGANPKLVARIPAQKPAYLHSFGMSEQYLVLVEFPFRLPSALSLLLTNKPFIENYRWMPEEGTRFTVIDKDSGEIVARAETEPFFCFHHVNAFVDDGELIVDLCAYDDHTIINTLYLDNLTKSDGNVAIHSFLRRYRLPLKNGTSSGGSVKFDQVSATSFELPRFNYRPHVGKPYRYVYGAGTHSNSHDFINQLVKIDLESGETKIWHADGTYPGEPIFVGAPDAAAEDDGVILAVVLDSGSGKSFLLLLDAASFAERARAEVPQHIPFGFHGQFFS
ncbi:MAG: carotenoid oxygenase family protein, partial [Chloroflexi bacterium]|nr:carotenoid oxygenase family protein [Chloroflexota bacterium]